MKGKFSLGRLIKFLIIGVIMVIAIGATIELDEIINIDNVSLAIKTYFNRDSLETNLPYAIDASQDELETYEIMQKSYDSDIKSVRDKGYTENIDGIIKYRTICIYELISVKSIQKNMDRLFIGIGMGCVLGALIYFILEIKIKYTTIKLLLGYILTFILSMIIVGIYNTLTYNGDIIDGIKILFEYHAINTIIIITLIYIISVVSNLLAQRKKAELLNNELNKDIK